MIVALDVHYDNAGRSATAAAVVFEHWEDAAALATYHSHSSDVEPYVPGEFFKRELPSLLAVLCRVREPLTVAVVDGFVMLGEKPGLGMRLWEALNGTIAVIGVAKTRFHSASAIEVTRGASKMPLYVTAVGIDPAEAAQSIACMHGAFRIPTLLRQVDKLARAASGNSEAHEEGSPLC